MKSDCNSSLQDRCHKSMAISAIIPHFLQVVSTFIQAQIREDTEGISCLLDKLRKDASIRYKIGCFYIVIIKRIAL